MSRIGKQPITIPDNTTITQEENLLIVKGPKGTLNVALLNGITVNQEGSELLIKTKSDNDRSFQGLLRTLINNAVTGVNKGWQKNLEINGVGMRAAVSGSGLTLNLGFSHQVNFAAPEGINFQVVKNVITISGIDKQLVGETAAQIRKLKKPEPYKGKGIRYANEYVRRKAGKTGKTGK